MLLNEITGLSQMIGKMAMAMHKTEEGLWVYLHNFSNADRPEHVEVDKVEYVKDANAYRIFTTIINGAKRRKTPAAPTPMKQTWFELNPEDDEHMTIADKDGKRTLMMKDGNAIST